VRGETIARTYAEAFFELADRHDALEEFGRALDAFVQLLEESEDLRLFLDTPRIRLDRKKSVLRDALGGKVPPLVLNFLLLVMDKGRQRFLRPIAEEYRKLVDERLGRTRVEVQVARPMDEEEMDGVRKRLSAILGKEAIPHVRVRPELVGGIVFRSGDTIFDGSVRRRLQGMRRRLLAADVSTDQG
jgi:F-type H+-transporting ATPase subunit delta